jgi:hypothetical protein
VIIKNHVLYERLKWIAQVGLPALGALYFGLAGIWGLPAAEQVVGSIVVIDTFLGVILQISTAQYNAENRMGTIDISKAGDKTVYTLNLNDDPEHLGDKETVSFRVNRPDLGG